MTATILDLDFETLPDRTVLPEQYHQASALVRIGGRPAAWVRVPVTGGAVTAAAVINAVRAQAEPAFWAALARRRMGVAESQPQSPAGWPRATVAVCTRDRPADLRRCLESLMRLPDDGQEILIIDSASNTGETRSVVAEFATVRYLRVERPGLNVARNAALHSATGDIVAFIDDDAVADTGWLRALVGAFANPLVLAATGLTLPLELETPAQEAFEAFTPFNRGFTPRTYTRGNIHPLAAGKAGAGVNMAVRREALLRVGDFDIALDAGTPTCSGGESEYFARIIRAGYRISYTPDALNWHCHRRTPAELRRAVYGYGVGIYAFWFSRLLAGELAVPLLAAIWFWRDQFPGMLRSLLRRPGAPPWPLPLDALRGCLAGPGAYLRARRAASKVTA